MTISGISSYLGAHTCLLFLKSNQYRVRGTVKSLSDTSILVKLKSAFGDYFNELEIVKADLFDTMSIIHAIEGSDVVLHTASPFRFKRNEGNTNFAAVKSAIVIMRACAATVSVKTCVIT